MFKPQLNGKKHSLFHWSVSVMGLDPKTIKQVLVKVGDWTQCLQPLPLEVSNQSTSAKQNYKSNQYWRWNGREFKWKDYQASVGKA